MSFFKKKIFRWVALVVVAAGLTGAVVIYKMYNKPHRSVLDANAVTVKAADLTAQYETDEAKANQQYLDKVLSVSGEVSDVSKNQKGEMVVTLKGTDMGGVICTMEEKESQPVNKGNSITLQGICTGYLTDVVLVRCYLVKQ